VAEGTIFLGAPEYSDTQDRLSTHFPDPKVVASLNRHMLEEKYLLPMGYKFIIPEADATINKPPSKCIAIYQAAFSHGIRFPLHPVIVDILNNTSSACIDYADVLAEHILFHHNV